MTQNANAGDQEKQMRRNEDKPKERSSEAPQPSHQGNIDLDTSEVQLRQAEQAPLESKEGYQFLVDHSKEIVLVLNKKGKIIFANKNTLKDFGYAEEELVGKSITRFLTGGSITKALYALAQEFLGRPQPELEVQAKTKSGEIRYLSVAEGSAPIHENGKLNGVMICANDITKLKFAEESLKKSEGHFKSLVEKSGIAISIDDEEGNLIYCNSRYADIFGYSMEEMRSQSILSIVHPDDVEKVMTYHRGRLQGKGVPSRYEFKGIRKDGSVIYLEVDVNVSREGERLSGTRSYMWDITERKLAEENLRKRNARLELVHHIQSKIQLSADIEAVLNQTAKSIGKTFGYYKISLNLYDRVTNEIEYLTGWNETGLPLPRGHRQKLGQGLIGKAGLLKQTVLANDVSKEQDYIPYHLIETKAELVIPLLVQDHLIGILDLQATEVDAFSKEDIAVLESVASYIAFMIERTQSEEAVRKSEAKLKEAQALGRIGSWEFDLDTQTIQWSDQVYRLYERDPAMGPPNVEEEAVYYSHEQAERLRENARIALEQGRASEYDLEARLPSGRVAHFTATLRPIKDGYGRVVKLIGTVQDITERKKAELTLRESEEKYRTLTENINIGIYRNTVGPKGRFLEANPTIIEMFGVNSKKEFMARNVSDFYQDESVREELNEKLIRNGFVRNEELFLKKNDGTPFIGSISAVAVKNEQGNVQYYDGAIEDITRRKQTEDELQRALEKVRQALGSIVNVLTATIEMKDRYTAGHQKGVADLARVLATEMGLPKDQIEGIRIAGTIHDLGKIFIPGEILCKPGILNEYEFCIFKLHPQVGFDILKDVKFPWPIAEIVYQHHERMDGSGYPRGLKKEQILIEARILAVADVLEAMSAHRPYRPALGIEAAIEEISRNRGILYDPEVVDAWAKLFSGNSLMISSMIM